MTSLLFEPLFALDDGAHPDPTSNDTTALDALLNDRHPITEAASAWATHGSNRSAAASIGIVGASSPQPASSA